METKSPEIKNEIIDFNINCHVLVKLTPKGRKILCKGNITIPKEDGEWSEWQLWYLMSIFGQYIYLGCEPPFETLIKIKPNSIK